MNGDIVLFGGLLLDRYVSIDRWPVRGQDGFFQQEEIFVGGCAVNMAVTIRNLGGSAHVVSCVGHDEGGQIIRDYLERHGLSQRLLHPVSGMTGSCLVFVEASGERTFLTRKGLEGEFPPELAQSVLGLQPGWAGVTGYYLLGNDAPRVLDCLEVLHQQGTQILFDPSPLVGEIPSHLCKRMVELSSVITPNETELSFLGGDAAALSGNGTAVCVKRGAAGGTVYGGKDVFDYGSPACVPVDTTGAGDSFSGALIYGLSRGHGLRQCVELAAWCAAKTVALHGPHGFWNLEGDTNV